MALPGSAQSELAVQLFALPHSLLVCTILPLLHTADLLRYLRLWELQLLSTLPALASSAATSAQFWRGGHDTLYEWMVVRDRQRGTRRRAVEAGVAEVKAQRHCTLLHFLHALAAKPSFVHLKLESCVVTTYVLDHMPVWPHLLSLSVHEGERLRHHPYDSVGARLPSLTSLASDGCPSVEQLLQMPRLQQLHLREYSW